MHTGFCDRASKKPSYYDSQLSMTLGKLGDKVSGLKLYVVKGNFSGFDII